jgi:peptidoglycan/LPS O-acetylase OafA/YrhL
MSRPRQHIIDFSDQRTNNLDFIRLFFASIVIVSHSFVFVRTPLSDPLDCVTKYQLSCGGLAVDGFFAISGFLVTASWLRSRGTMDFLRKRVLRIHPGFIVCCLFCILIVGPTGQPDVHAYFRGVDWLRFAKNALLLNKIQLPSTFENLRGFPADKIDGAINGALWTIKIEFECYVFLAVLALLGLMRRPWAAVAILAITWSMYVVLGYPSISSHLPAQALLQHLGAHWRFVTYFLMGVATFLFRSRIPYERRLVGIACLLFVVASVTGTGSALMPPSICYVLFYIAFNPRIQLRNVAEKRDLSYGIYLYGWPIQYLWMLALGRDVNPYVFALIALPTAALCALASWTLVESPSLALKGSRRLSRVEVQPVA